MPTDRTVNKHDLSALLHSGDTPRSPDDLDQRIVQHARRKAEEYADYSSSTGFRWLGDGWKTALAVFSVSAIAISVSIQIYNRDGSRIPVLDETIPIAMERANEEQNVVSPAPVTTEALQRIEPASAVSPQELETTTVLSQPVYSRDVEAQRQLADSTRADGDRTQEFRTVGQNEPADTATADAVQARREEIEEVVVTGNFVRGAAAAAASPVETEQTTLQAASAAVASEPSALAAPPVAQSGSVNVMTPPDNLADLLAAIRDDAVVSTPLGRLPVSRVPTFLQPLEDALDLLRNVLSENGIEVPDYPTASTTLPEPSQLAGKAQALVRAYGTIDDNDYLAELETGFREARENFRVIDLPPTLELTIGQLNSWLTSR